ncbi:hypothetical protein FH5_03386 [Priestia endophytica]|nr:hypothetical protein FH5_03386 [Priestia endophytica]
MAVIFIKEKSMLFSFTLENIQKNVKKGGTEEKMYDKLGIIV